MKPSVIGMVAAAILLVMAAVGLGIAQAGGNPSASGVWSVQDQIETGNLPEPAQAAPSPQIGGPVETGNPPEPGDVNDLDHSDVPREGNIRQYWGSDNPSN